MTDENRSQQRTTLLVVFGMMFVTVGLAIDDSYRVLSFLFLGLGVLLPFIAVVLDIGEDDTLDSNGA